MASLVNLPFQSEEELEAFRGVKANEYDQSLDLRGDKVPFFIELVDKKGVTQSLTYDDRGEVVVGLRLGINPTTVNVNFAKIINRTQTMTSWLEEHWGEELDTITFQGFTAAFVYKDVANFSGRGGGLSVENRKKTTSYKEFTNIIDIFKTNGCTYDSMGFVAERLYILITYDYSSYMGYFESIDVIEEANNPFRFNYTITFKAERTVYSFGARMI